MNLKQQLAVRLADSPLWQRWQRLAPRERTSLSLLGAFLLAVLFYLWLWLPAQRQAAAARDYYQAQRELHARERRARHPPLSDHRLAAHVRAEQVHRAENQLLAAHEVVPRANRLGDAHQLSPPRRVRRVQDILMVLDPLQHLPQVLAALQRITRHRVQRAAHRLTYLADLAQHRRAVRKDHKHILIHRLLARRVLQRLLDLHRKRRIGARHVGGSDDHQIYFPRLASGGDQRLFGGGHAYLELTGEDVTECMGGARSLTEVDLERAYKSQVDPRLNYEQALETAMLIVRKQTQISAPR